MTHRKRRLTGVARRSRWSLRGALVVGMRHRRAPLRFRPGQRCAPAGSASTRCSATCSPHVGPVSVLAVLLAIAVVAWGPALAARLSWRRLLALGYAGRGGVDLRAGPGRRLATRRRGQPDHDGRVPARGARDHRHSGVCSRTFASRILDFQPDSWTTHVSGHPPGATLVFVWLDRIGLSGGAPRPCCCRPGRRSRGGRRAGDDRHARSRRPGSRGVAVRPCSSRAPCGSGCRPTRMFAGRHGGRHRAVRDRPAIVDRLVCRAGGVLLGFGIFLSYGLVLHGRPIALAVVLVTRNWRALVARGARARSPWSRRSRSPVSGGSTAITWSSSATTRASRRTGRTGYWVWANLACLALAVGPAAVAGLRRARLPC